MIDCPPTIGFFIADGQTVQLATMAIETNRLPPPDMLLETVMAVLDWLDVRTGEVNWAKWLHSNCTPRTSPLKGGSE